MVFNLLKSKKKTDLEIRFNTFSNQLAQVFAQIKTDISDATDKIESNHREMERITRWIDYLNRSNQRLAESHSKLLQKYEKVSENNIKLHSSHRELSSSHFKTASLAENLENRHQELSGVISKHKESIKSGIQEQFDDQRKTYTDEIDRLKSWVDYFSSHIDRQKGREDDVKQDMVQNRKLWLESYSKLRELVNNLKNENSELKESISSVTSELRKTNEELETTKYIAKSAKSTSLEAKSEFSEQIKSIKSIQPTIQPIAQQQAPPPQQVPQIVSSGPTSFQRHIISRVMPNRKGYVIKFILNLASESKYSTKEVEEIVVNEKQLCGRTSFYAYLKELKLRGKLNYADIDERTIIINIDNQQTILNPDGKNI